MSSRPDITEALGVRSDEQVVVFAHADSDFQYPEGWKLYGQEAVTIDELTVCIVDRIELSRRLFAEVTEASPRLFAFVVSDIESEKQVRRMVTALFPWNEVWVAWTSFGKVLMTKDARGKAYYREDIIDRRPVSA